MEQAVLLDIRLSQQLRQIFPSTVKGGKESMVCHFLLQMNYSVKMMVWGL